MNPNMLHSWFKQKVIQAIQNAEKNVNGKLLFDTTSAHTMGYLTFLLISCFADLHPGQI